MRGGKRVWSVFALACVVSGSAFAIAAPPKSPPQNAPRAYAKNVQSWHSVPQNRAPARSDAGRALLSLVALNTNEHIDLEPLTDDGGFSEEDLDRLSIFLREPSTGNRHPIHPRLVDSIYRIQTHFNAIELRVLSGYRTPHGGRLSNHGRGRAMDFIVPGHSDEDVARFAREQGFSGVGVYPNSGFVHVDVRDKSYFWIDPSGPGRKNRERGIHLDIAAHADARAISRGEKPVESYAIDWSFDHANTLFDGGAHPADPDEDDTTDSDSMP